MDGLMLLVEAQSAGLEVLADRERLIVRGPKEAAAAAARLLAHKAEVLAALTSTAGSTPGAAASPAQSGRQETTCRLCAHCGASIPPNRPASRYCSADCALAAPVEPWEPAPTDLPRVRQSSGLVPPPALCHECRGAEVGPGGYYCHDCMETYYQAHPDHRPSQRGGSA
jgi:hypothetical protein